MNSINLTGRITDQPARPMRHEEWVAADERRHSPDIDYGTTWSDPARPGVQHRVAWNSGSGDLYLATHPGGEHLKVLLAHVDRNVVDRILYGWADRAVDSTLRWVRHQTLLARLSGIGDAARPDTTFTPAAEPVAGEPGPRKARPAPPTAEQIVTSWQQPRGAAANLSAGLGGIA